MCDIMLKYIKFLLFSVIINITSGLKTFIEVPLGRSVILPCTSNAGDHYFAFWELASNDIIGPGNPYDKHKYEYDVLSGKLHIKYAEIEEQGTYTCVSRDIDDLVNIDANSVQLFITRDWEDAYEHDKTTNTLRVIILIGCILIMIMGSYLIYTKWKGTHRLQPYLDDNDDSADDNDEIFSTPGPSHSSSNMNTPKLDDINTDFGGIYKQTTNK